MKKILLISLKTTQPPLLLFNVLNLFKRVLEFNVMTTVKLPSLNIYLDPQSVVEIHKLRQIYQTHNKTFQWNGMHEMLFEFVYIDKCFGTHLLHIVISKMNLILLFRLPQRSNSTAVVLQRWGQDTWKEKTSSVYFQGIEKNSQILHKSSEPRMRTL